MFILIPSTFLCAVLKFSRRTLYIHILYFLNIYSIFCIERSTIVPENEPESSSIIYFGNSAKRCNESEKSQTRAGTDLK